MAFAATAYSTRRLFPVDPIYVADYTTLRGIVTHSLLCFVTGYYGVTPPSTTAGWFIRDDNDTTSADDGTDTIVASNGKRWKRIFQDETALPLPDYAALRALTATTSSVVITGEGFGVQPAYFVGEFTHDSADTTSADNGGTIIVDVLGRRWKREAVSNAIKPEWFKTVADNDWTSAVENALIYCGANGCILDAGARSYTGLSKKIIVNGTRVFGIVGRGQELTNFIFEGNDVGFDLYCPARTDPAGGAIVLHNFSVLKKADAATSVWGGTALKVTTGTVTGGNPSLTATLHNITVGGAPSDTTSAKRFTHGIHLVNCWQAQLSNVYVTGAIPLNTSAISAGIWFQDSTGCRLNNVHNFRFQRHYYVTGSTEGPTMVSCHGVGGQDGVVVDGPTTDDPSNPGLDISCCHFNIQRYAIRATNRAQGIITGCLFYEFENTTETEYKAVWCDGTSRQWHIANNTFTNKVTGSAPTKYAIHWAGEGSGNQFNNNIIRTGGLTYGIVLEANTTETYVLDNSMHGLSIGANAFINNATDKTTIRYRSATAGGTPYNTWGLVSTALTIPNNAATLLSFAATLRTGEAGIGLADSTAVDDGAVVAAARINSPNYAYRVRLSGNLSWDANTTGTRTIEVFKNGAATERGLPSTRINATSALAAQHGFVTAPIDVVPGDYFTVKVTQTSGANLDLQSSTRCYVTMEILA